MRNSLLFLIYSPPLFSRVFRKLWKIFHSHCGHFSISGLKAKHKKNATMITMNSFLYVSSEGRVNKVSAPEKKQKSNRFWHRSGHVSNYKT